MDNISTTTVLHPLIGQTFGQYRVESFLGQGGMGVVYRGQDLKLQRPLALKLLSPDLTSDSERKKRFLLEARAAARISHPAIAQVYDVDEFEGAIVIAMELVEGKTVGQLIRNRELDLLGAIDIAVQVAEGLTKAHDLGIVHRDVKPANVMVTPEGHAKILDFGLAKLIDPSDTSVATATGLPELTTLTQTQVGAVKGTAAYMSPEQVKGNHVDARSDLFSLGIMLFEMATGELPFRRPTMVETMHAVAFDETPSLHTFQPNLPVDLQRIVARCLQKKPEDRYPSARALADELRVLRRDTEAGQARFPGLRERIGNMVDRFGHLKPSHYAWLAAGVLGLSVGIYLLMANVGLAGFVFFLVVGVSVFRRIRNRPQDMREMFVRKVAKIPEVQVIAGEGEKLTVVVDRVAAQLYGRINDQLDVCNKRLYFGSPMSVAIRHDLTAEETKQLLTSPGVRFVREGLFTHPDQPPTPPPKTSS